MDIGVDHQAHEFLEAGLRHPTEPGPGLLGVAYQKVDLGRAVVAGIDLDMTLPVEPGDGKRSADKVTDGMGFARCDDVVIGLILLEHYPHRLDVFLGVAPVASSLEVPEHELVLASGLDGGDPAGDLPCHESLAAPRRLVVEEDSIGNVETVGLAIV